MSALHINLTYLYLLTCLGEMGYFRILMGKNALGIESEVAWATPGEFTVHNKPCYEDGSNCQGTEDEAIARPRYLTMKYQDPSQAPHLLSQYYRQQASTDSAPLIHSEPRLRRA
jgi:hypothetical protein